MKSKYHSPRRQWGRFPADFPERRKTGRRGKGDRCKDRRAAARGPAGESPRPRAGVWI